MHEVLSITGMGRQIVKLLKWWKSRMKKYFFPPLCKIFSFHQTGIRLFLKKKKILAYILRRFDGCEPELSSVPPTRYSAKLSCEARGRSHQSGTRRLRCCRLSSRQAAFLCPTSLGSDSWGAAGERVSHYFRRWESGGCVENGTVIREDERFLSLSGGGKRGAATRWMTRLDF